MTGHPEIYIVHTCCTSKMPRWGDDESDTTEIVVQLKDIKYQNTVLLPDNRPNGAFPKCSPVWTM